VVGLLFQSAQSLFLSAALQKLRTHASKIKACAPVSEEYPKNMHSKRKTTLRLKLTGLMRALDSLEDCVELPICEALFRQCVQPAAAWFSHVRNLNRWPLALSREQIHPSLSLSVEEPSASKCLLLMILSNRASSLDETAVSSILQIKIRLMMQLKLRYLREEWISIKFVSSLFLY